MNSLGYLRAAYENKTVLVTGHTGFKGAWLCEWLLQLGARVVGIALAPNTTPSLFDQLDLAGRIEHHLQDIRDRDAFGRLVLDAQPDYVFHLAAQALVRTSYAEPVETYATNLMGTVHLLDALRRVQAGYVSTDGKVCAAVLITSDKCYGNREWLSSYREDDPMGGYDPYSASKACAELATASFRQSFFDPEKDGRSQRVGIATARAGNVIGGGDWALDRIVPDCVRHLQREAPIPVRNPAATRPWQHVLEPLSGYLMLGMRQHAALEAQSPADLARYCSAFNFGPALTSNRSVEALVRKITEQWPGRWLCQAEPGAPHEARNLNLAWDKAFHLLGWEPVWGFDESVARTIGWYRQQFESHVDPTVLVQADLAEYARGPREHARGNNIPRLGADR